MNSWVIKRTPYISPSYLLAQCFPGAYWAIPSAFEKSQTQGVYHFGWLLSRKSYLSRTRIITILGDMALIGDTQVV